MLLACRFQADYRCFKSGELFEFRPGVNILVGDQGAGKSTLLQQIVQLTRLPECMVDKHPLLVKTDKQTNIISFDFEKDNPRGKPLPKEQRRFMPVLLTHFLSHGQTVNGLLERLEEEAEPATFIMDEPDMALSIRSIRALVRKLQEAEKRGHQVISSAHNPLLIEGFSAVLSLEHRRWMTSGEFIQSHTA